MKILCAVLLVVILSACSSGEEKTSERQSTGDHILKDQVRALEKAKEVGQLMQNTTDKQRQALEGKSK